MPRSHGYQSFSDLSKHENRAHFHIQKSDQGTGLLLFTPHGGGIEPGASEITRALAGEEYSYYCFEGQRMDGNDGLHITSTRFDEPIGTTMIAKAETIITVHGCGDRRNIIYVGGLDLDLRDQFLRSFRAGGFETEIGRGHISGKSPRNICNRGKSEKGVQLELSEGLRKTMFRSLDKTGREHKTPVFERLIRAGKKVLEEVNNTR